MTDRTRRARGLVACKQREQALVEQRPREQSVAFRGPTAELPGLRASEMSKAAIGFGRERREGEDQEAINRMFTPEFRNRLDATITFGGLTPEIIDRVVEKFILQLEVQLEDRNVTIEVSKPARDWLAKRGFDADMGARPLARTIQEYVKKPMAEELLFGKLTKGGVVKIDLDKKTDELTFKYIAEPAKKKKATKDEAEEPAA